MAEIEDGSPGKFCGYTLDQIRRMDVWFQQQNLSWQILDERYKEGFEAGVRAERQIIQEQINQLNVPPSSKQSAGSE